MYIFPGTDDFKGKILHAREYHNSTGFEGKRVIVVGMGNSAGDVACDVSNVAKQVRLPVGKTEVYVKYLDLLTRSIQHAFNVFPVIANI